jgi:hypothetical protein
MLADALFIAIYDTGPGHAAELAHDCFGTESSARAACLLNVHTATEAGIEDAIKGFGVRDFASLEVYADATGVVLRTDVFMVNVLGV